ncbi:hypothetical protein DNTS_021610 [Danionella cerebrum]|uniref:Uncharacterized protein n=1 Tax=Danionella cerebrum TaxID=2873325 RepID=A0A553QXN2_9TELE|nr:hypothetical protein DNTS_021610 [Danionella translucida]
MTRSCMGASPEIRSGSPLGAQMFTEVQQLVGDQVTQLPLPPSYPSPELRLTCDTLNSRDVLSPRILHFHICISSLFYAASAVLCRTNTPGMHNNPTDVIDNSALATAWHDAGSETNTDNKQKQEAGPQTEWPVLEELNTSAGHL